MKPIGNALAPLIPPRRDRGSSPTGSRGKSASPVARQRGLGAGRGPVVSAIAVALMMATPARAATDPAADGAGKRPPPSLKAIPESLQSKETIVTKPEGASASAAARKNPHLAAKLDRRLLEAWHCAQTEGVDAARGMLMKGPATMADNHRDLVAIVTPEADANLAQLEKLLREQGAGIVRSGPFTIKVVIPVEKIEAAGMVPGVESIRAIRQPRENGSVTSEGTRVVQAEGWHSFGRLGQGVRVAVVDSGFANFATLQAQGEIPASATMVNYTTKPMGDGTSSHGSACAEIIHDVAPGAALFLIKIDDPTDLWAASYYCISNSIGIVSCSLGWDGMNFHDGLAQRNPYSEAADHPVAAADAAAAAGILWVNAAGNERLQHTFVQWRDGGTSDGFLDWTSANTMLNAIFWNGSATIPAGTTLSIVMTWNRWPTTNQDFDLFLYRDTGSGWARVTTGFVAGYDGSDLQTGNSKSYPVEEIFHTTTVSARYAVAVHRYSASSAPAFILRFSGSSEPQYFGYSNFSTPVPGSICVPADAASTFAVGALDWDTYLSGGIASYSSLGPNNRQYTGGSALMKPDICGPVQVTCATYGDRGYAGTSAATPHVAGLATLIRGGNPGFTLAELRADLQDHAYDLGPAGLDSTFGAGAARLGPCPGALAEAIDTPAKEIASGSANHWVYQTAVTKDGVDAAQSGAIGNSSASRFSCAVEGPGTVRFWWKVSSESGYDWLMFSIDGVVQPGRISGNVDWREQVVPLSAGSHTLEPKKENETVSEGCVFPAPGVVADVFRRGLSGRDGHSPG